MTLREELEQIDGRLLARVAVSLLNNIENPDSLGPAEKLANYPELTNSLGSMLLAAEQAGIPEARMAHLVGGIFLLAEYAEVVEVQKGLDS